MAMFNSYFDITRGYLFTDSAVHQQSFGRIWEMTSTDAVGNAEWWNPNVFNSAVEPFFYFGLDKTKQGVSENIWKCLDDFIYTRSGWWLEHVLWRSIQLGISSSQLTFIFFRGVGIPPARLYIIQDATSHSYGSVGFFFARSSASITGKVEFCCQSLQYQRFMTANSLGLSEM